jgi:hypothetical protein
MVLAFMTPAADHEPQLGRECQRQFLESAKVAVAMDRPQRADEMAEMLKDY